MKSTWVCHAETYDSCIEGMIGRKLESNFPPKRDVSPDAETILRLDGLTSPGRFDDVSFEVHAGEIVALAGLVGSGRSEIARAIFGADPFTDGQIELRGEPVRFGSPREAIDHGVAMIPESRKDQGLLLGRSVRENVSLPHLAGLSSMGVVGRRAERSRVGEMMQRVDYRGSTMEKRASSSSGGNQQKMLFARWLMTDPPLLIADEPTRGVDVGSKRNIYDLLAQLATQGTAILVVSSEAEEVLGLADRILVLREGRLIAELDGRTATEEELVSLAFGANTAAA